MYLQLDDATLMAVWYQANAQAKGFSWMHNYWCNLLNDTGINGEPNPGRSVASAAMIVLSLSLMSFWIVAAYTMRFKKTGRTIVFASGIMAVVLLPFLPTAYHDSVINVAGAFSLIAMGGAYSGVYRNGWHGLFAFGIFNLLLVGVNNYLYYAKGLLYYLPVVQKMTFLACLLWIDLVVVKLYRQSAKGEQFSNP